MNTQPSARNYAFDAARVLAILSVFIFHVSRFFDTGGWHVKNPVRYDGMEIWAGFLGNWLMPLIFLVSGAGLYYALQRPNVLRFLKDKVLRLLVPLAFGATTHVALQVYLERRAQGAFGGSFFDFYPHYFDGLYRLGGNFAWMGLHLWYLEVLFVFSVLLLPVLLWLRSRSGATVLGAVARFLALPGLVFLMAVPGALLFPQLNPSSILFGNTDWGGWALPMYLPYLLGGFMIGSSVELQERIRRQRFLSLGIALLLTAVLIPLAGSPGDESFGTRMYAVVGVLSCFASWAYVMTILGLCLQHLNRPSPLLARANQAVLPFYILHQSVMIGLGWFIVRWPIPDAAKFVLIAAATLVICLGSYELIIRRFNLTRFLFGMKPLPRATAETAAKAVPTSRSLQPTAAIASGETGQRRVLALDWVRVLAICVVFLFHSIRAFTVEGWQVHNAVSYEGLDIVTGVVSTWMMPIIFVVSGASLTLSLRGGRASSGRGGINFGRLLRTRLLRLAVPFVAGVFTHVALQVYLDRVNHGAFTGSLFEFYPHYFEGLYGAGGNFAWDGLHLWYLMVLLAFTLLSLPLLAWMKSRTGEIVLGWMRARLTGVWAPLILAIPVALVTSVLGPNGPLAYSNGGWSAGAYLMFYLAGLLVIPDPAVWESLQRYRRITLALTVGLLVLLLACVLTWGDPVPGTPYYIAGMTLRAIGAWLGLAAALGFAGRHLERDSALRSRANEAVLVVYILHQTVLVTVGFFVLRWTIPDPAKYVIILVSSIAIVAGLYEGVVRRWNIMRFLFGMKPRVAAVERQPVAQPAGLPDPA